MYRVRWEIEDKLHLCETESFKTAMEIYDMVSAHWFGEDGLYLQVEEGAKILAGEWPTPKQEH